jgi:hypothetical protein
MSNAALVQKIAQAAQSLPDQQAVEALNFILFLQLRQERAEWRDLQDAQQSSMNHVWANDADEAWNHV